MEIFDDQNSVFKQAAAFVNNTNQTLFLTGKAGTGKTTFLKYIRNHASKKMAVVAPTGVAAINAGGTTIHSFFQLPFGTYLPAQGTVWGGAYQNSYNKNQLLKNLRLRQTQRDLIKSLDLLIIDEISMVRSDVLDAVDAVLRSVRRRNHEPFGGVQMLFIGDLFQLPPVIKNKEWDLMSTYYKSPFFFDAQVLKESSLVCLELQKVYRQEDIQFISLLQSIRNNCCTKEDMELLHYHYNPDFDASSQPGFITLTSHNQAADILNNQALDQLPGNAFEISAVIKADFPEQAYPVEKILRIKEGAQIMFIKNDKGEDRRYYNGKLGIVKYIDPREQKIRVAFPDEPETLELELETWKNIRYEYDKEKDQVKEEELGTFQHYPIRLAWAVTIHKSQGLTFEKAVIDAGRSFAAGQVYVALSRLISLDGLILKSRIHPHNIIVDPRIQQFSARVLSEDAACHLLESAQLEYVKLLLLQAYDWGYLDEEFSLNYREYEQRIIPEKDLAIRWASKILDEIKELQGTAVKFHSFLQQAFRQDRTDYNKIHEKNTGAANWFAAALEEKIIDSLKGHIREQSGRPRIKSYLVRLKNLLHLAERKKMIINRSLMLTEALLRSEDVREAMQAFNQPAVVAGLLPDVQPDQQESSLKGKKPKTEKGASAGMSLALFRQGLSIDQIATQRGYAKSTIEGHLMSFIASGEIDVHFFVKEDKREKIASLFRNNPDLGRKGLKERLGDDFSYSEIKAALEFAKKEAGT